MHLTRDWRVITLSVLLLAAGAAVGTTAYQLQRWTILDFERVTQQVMRKAKRAAKQTRKTREPLRVSDGLLPYSEPP